MVKNNPRSNGIAKESVKETEAVLSEKQKQLKEKRCKDCWDEIQQSLKKYNCDLEPQMILTVKGIQPSFNISAK